MSDKRIYLDMDGVLCEYRADATLDDWQRNGYFLDLAPRQPMVDAVKYIASEEDWQIFVISSVMEGHEEEARKEKNIWLDIHLPFIDISHRFFPVCGTEKSSVLDCVTSCDILCDDYSRNLESWRRAGGSAIKIINEINGRGGSFIGGPRLEICRREELAEAIRAL